MEERGFDGAVRPDFWLSHVRIGVWLTQLACLLGVVYVVTEPGLDHRVPIIAILAGVAAGTGVILVLPLPAILAHRRASWFFYAWSCSAVVLTTIGCLLDGGSRSPFVSFYFLMLVYAATAYPPRVLLHVAILIVGLYTTMAIGDGTAFGEGALVAGALGLTVWMSEVAARNQWQRLQEQVALARIDGLTGCLNHRAFREVLHAEVERATRLDRPLSLLVLDLDGFKEVNDGQGHLAGDAVLQAMGALLRDVVRRIDVVGRIGGDEFAVLLIEVGIDEALEIGDRVCSHARAIDAPTTTSVSVGVAELSDTDTATTLLREADAALYEAKRAGRNRVRHRTGSPRADA
jgi:diguanylate cyclase (GGDEF)-like protein